MKKRMCAWLLFSFLAALSLLAAGCASRDIGANRAQNASANQSQTYSRTCTVSFDLFHYDKPFSNEWLTVFPLVDGKISTSAANNLGSGQTDANGYGTIDFKCSNSPAKYVLLWESKKNECCMMLRHQGLALSFSCGESGPTCNAGKVVFEVFESAFRSGVK